MICFVEVAGLEPTRTFCHSLPKRDCYQLQAYTSKCCLGERTRTSKGVLPLASETSSLPITDLHPDDN